MSIQIFNRRLGRIETERVFGASWVEWAYGSSLGRKVVGLKSIQKLSSQFIGFFMKSPLSVSKVEPFIKDFEIQMSDFETPSGGFSSFNDFFIRKLAPGVRSFPEQSRQLGSPAEGRVSVYPIKNSQCMLSVKGHWLPLDKLLGSKSTAQEFEGGHVYVLRLCPVDYHRFHFPDSGSAQKPVPLKGVLHSVNPKSLEVYPDVFLKNERQLTRLHSTHFGDLLILEVGAIGVGKIVQSFSHNEPIVRGQEKGYFEFGGSTVILVSPAKIRPSEDLLSNTQKGLETLVQVGDIIGEI